MKKYRRNYSRYLFPVLTVCSLLLFTGGANGYGAKHSEKKFESPVRIAFGPADNLIVSDYSTNSIYTVDRNKNKILRGFEIKGRPLAVAYHKGKYYVGNNTTGKIEVYLESGKMKSSFQGTIKKPNDMVIDSSGERVYVADTLGSRIFIYSIDGQRIKTITDQLTSPTGIALDEINGLIYVSDYGDPGDWIYPAVRIFNLDGIYTGSISGKLGMFGNRFSRPQGLAVDDNGYVFMVDCYSAEIMVFNGPGGILVKTLSGFGTAPGKMRLPYDIALNNKNKDIFVTNFMARTIEIFRGGGKL